MLPMPPPSVEDLRSKQTLIAGRSKSTILADIDFETKSEAGFIWDEEKRKFRGLTGTKKGLKAVGVSVYSEHPTTEVICMAYNLKDGFGSRRWKPGDPAPLDLFYHLQDGGLLEAWNVAFEYYIWINVCMPKYLFPPLNVSQLRCAAAKSRAFALPGGLDECGKVLNIKNKKLKDGKRLLTKYSQPRNPTKKNPNKWNDIREDIKDFEMMQKYNEVDIKAEAELSMQIPDLSPFELDFWQADQRINRRGVKLDREAIQNCIHIVKQAFKKYEIEIVTLTDGAVESIGQIAALRDWMMSYGVHTPSLDAEHVKNLLVQELPKPVRRILEIRSLIGSAAIKKLYAMMNTMSKDDRVRDTIIYHTARTGRAGGDGIQPHNLPNNNKLFVTSCDGCDRYFQAANGYCPWCGHTEHKTEQEWKPKAIDEALSIISTRSLSCLEFFYDDPIGIISGCLRGMLIADKDKVLISSDYSSIEAIVLACIAQEDWHLEVYKTHGRMYEMTASKISGVPLEEFIRVKKDTGQHHPLRKMGKVASLACFGPHTQVLTDVGYLDIKDVTTKHKLWDGVEWVTHDGVINKGLRKVLDLDGIQVTPNHPISLGDSWKEAKILASNENILYQALEIGSANLPSSVSKKMIKSESNVPVMQNPTLSSLLTCVNKKLQDVISAPKRNLVKLFKQNITGNIRNSFPIKNTEDDYSIEYRRQSEDVIEKKIGISQTMAVEGYQFLKIGEKINHYFLNILSRCKVGTTRILKWIEPIAIKGMNRGISDLFQEKKTPIIKDKYKKCRKESITSNTVYDIVNAGPRNRFTIKTSSGHLIVHNSGYGGWVNAWIKFKGDEFLTEEEMKTAIMAWRNSNRQIVRLWKELETAAHMAVRNPGREFGYNGIKYLCQGEVLYCELYSGRFITYHKPRLELSTRRPGTLELIFDGWNSDTSKGKRGWIRMSTYGGRLTENVCQAVSRDILAHAIVNLEKRGYPVVLHVHDEIVCEVPEGFGSIEELESIMMEMPDWASDWPIKARGGWKAKRYQK